LLMTWIAVTGLSETTFAPTNILPDLLVTSKKELLDYSGTRHKEATKLKHEVQLKSSMAADEWTNLKEVDSFMCPVKSSANILFFVLCYATPLPSHLLTSSLYWRLSLIKIR